MRTLKKVLALSLVFAMAFTLMAGAAYKDEDSIDSSLRDDITLMEALGVFQGDENGNFNPTNNVTRAEAAKMIYVLKNNGVDDGATAFQGVSKYSDVTTGFWAEGYINYCTNLGYMSGWSENGVQKFDPNGNVTGVQLAKMLLCMIGYRADIQGYTNNNAWQTNVQQDAAEAGILTNFTPSLYTPVCSSVDCPSAGERHQRYLCNLYKGRAGLWHDHQRCRDLLCFEIPEAGNCRRLSGRCW